MLCWPRPPITPRRAPSLIHHWKLIRHYNTHLTDELYDLQDDPGEMKNRYTDASTQNVRDGLQRRLEEWMRSIDDPLLR